MRSIGAFVVAPKIVTGIPSHRVIHFFVVFRDLAGACEATSHISEHIAPHRTVNIVVSTRLFQQRKRVIHRPRAAPSLAGRLQASTSGATLKKPSWTHANWTKFNEAVEKEFTGTFLLALGDEEAFSGRSQGQKWVWKACKRPFLRQFSAWQSRNAGLAPHTARPRLDASGTSTLAYRASNDLLASSGLDALSLPHPLSGRRGTRPTWPSSAWLTGSCVLAQHDSVWTLMGSGCLDEGEPHDSDKRPWPLPLPAPPSQRGHHSVERFSGSAGPGWWARGKVSRCSRLARRRCAEYSTWWFFRA